MVPAYIRLREFGAGFESVSYEGLMLLIQMVVYFAFACFAYKFAIRRFGNKINMQKLG